MTELVKTCKAAPAKKEVVKRIEEFSKKYPIIGIVNMEGLPASSLLKMKKQLRGKVELIMTRKTLIILGLKNAKLPEGDKLMAELKGMPALMFTKENPFSLYKIIKQSKTPAPAKPGQLAPRDITLEPGLTPFAPGPVISEFAQLGVKASVEEGKVAIKAPATVVREGEPISGPLASMLTRLGIEPMEVGMDLRCVYEKGTIYAKSVLDIDEEQFMTNLLGAAHGAMNLAIEVVYTTKDTIERLLAKAHSGARNVGIEGGVLAPELVEEVLATAARKAKALASEAKIETS